MALICISLVIKNIEPLFTCLFDMYVLFEMYIQIFFVLFINGLVVLWLNFETSLYVLSISSLLDMFCKYFLPVCRNLLIFLVSFEKQKFKFWCILKCIKYKYFKFLMHQFFSSMVHAFFVLYINLCLTCDHRDCILYFILDVM